MWYLHVMHTYIVTGRQAAHNIAVCVSGFVQNYGKDLYVLVCADILLYCCVFCLCLQLNPRARERAVPASRVSRLFSFGGDCLPVCICSVHICVDVL